LLFFVIVLTIFTPLGVLGSLGRGIGPFAQFQWLAVLMLLVQAVFSVWTGVGLWTRRTHALLTAYAYLAYLVVMGVVFVGFSLLAQLPSPFYGEALVGSLGQLIGYVLVAGIWGLYLHKSQRVRETYGTL
jgi:hypothetical protein